MRLSPVSRTELIRRLKLLGWEGPISGGKHQFMVKGSIQLTIPNPHGSGEIGVNLLRLVLKEAGIARCEWLSAR
jgi:predicted RNA binding protein YcfA (HicA-like mRNA interferase family)